jgi:CBS domain-containing protein
VDIPSFLRSHPPFDELDEDELASVVLATRIEFFPEYQVILAQDGEPASFLYVVRKGSVEVLDGDLVIDLHQEGEVFGFVSLLTGERPALTARAAEETICYLIEPAVAEDILATKEGASFLSRSVRRRELKVLERAEPRADPWTLPARTLVARRPVAVAETDTVRAVAERMATERVSSALVRVGEAWGIVTDRDLRTRVLAEGRGPEHLVAEVASTPLLSLPEDATIGDVLGTMLERGIHHVPLADGSGAIVGVLTDTDLMALERRSAFQVRRGIERAADPRAASRLALAVPETTADLIEAGVDALEVAHVITVTTDVLTTRLLSLAIERLGEPPGGWAWLALGGEARQELSLVSDQDNALVFASDEDPSADAYFARLAAVVNDGLASAGIPRCRSGVIASNVAWRGSVERWCGRFRSWIADPDGSRMPAVALDHRVVAGALDVDEAFAPILADGSADRAWLRHLARAAVERPPPKGFLRDAVIEARGTSAVVLDARDAGIATITALARIQGLRAGVHDRRTVRRLRGAVAGGRIGGEVGTALEEAFQLLWRIRLGHQVARVRAGAPPDDDVDPRSLGPLARQALKEAFRLIDRAQGLLALELDLRR